MIIVLGLRTYSHHSKWFNLDHRLHHYFP
ncbi:tryptophanase leader peptide [Gallibacterium genomosp. 3]